MDKAMFLNLSAMFSDDPLSDSPGKVKGRKTQKRRKKWSEKDEVLLLKLWKEKLPQLRSKRKNRHIYAEIARLMTQQGSVFETGEIKAKMHNFTTKYRCEKSLIGPSGGSPSKWCHFTKLHEILGPFKSSKADILVEESIVTELSNEFSVPRISTPMPSFSDESSSEPEKKKSKTSSFQEMLLEKIDVMNEAMSEEGKKLISIQSELLAVEKERNVILREFLKTFKNK